MWITWKKYRAITLVTYFVNIDTATALFKNKTCGSLDEIEAFADLLLLR
jgi:hypothetical protein